MYGGYPYGGAEYGGLPPQQNLIKIVKKAINSVIMFTKNISARLLSKSGIIPTVLKSKKDKAVLTSVQKRDQSVLTSKNKDNIIL